MKVKALWVALGCAASVFSLTSRVPASAAERHGLVIGAGEVTGFYFPTAGALCRVLNKEHPDGFACSVAPSSGSAANVAALRAGETDFAILQSRAAMLAAKGAEGFQDAGPMPDLRAVMSLHGEAVAVLARQGSGIETLADLKGKRVNLGRPGSFQRAMAEMVLEAAGMSEGDLAPAVEMDLAEEAAALCEGNIDAAFFTGVQPVPEAASAVDECDATLVPVKSKHLDAYLKRNPWMSHGTIKRGTYDGVNNDVPTLQMRAVLTTTAQVPADEVYDVLKALHANFPALTHLHPVLKGLNRAETSKDGIAIKLHEGAEKFYSEAGLGK